MRSGGCWGDWLAYEAGAGRDHISERMACAEIAAVDADAENTLEGGDKTTTETKSGVWVGVETNPTSPLSSPFPSDDTY